MKVEKIGMQKKHLCYYLSSSSGILSHSLIRSDILAKTNSETTFKMMVGFWRTFPASMMNRGEKSNTFLRSNMEISQDISINWGLSTAWFTEWVDILLIFIKGTCF